MACKERSTLRMVLALLLVPLTANAGVVYEVAVRPVDQSELALSSPNAPPVTPVVTEYFVETGKVRVGGAKAKTAYVFKDKTMYVIDTLSHVVHVLHHATLGQVAAHYAEAVKQLQEAAAKAAPDDRAEAQRKASDMQVVSDRIRQPVARDLRVTVRFESVDGHACRIWEEREQNAKRFELCVAQAASVPGGAEILGGLKTLSEFREGSNFALGVDFGLSEWWPDIDTLGGIPLLVREYKYDSQIAEVMLSGLRPGVQNTGQFEVPDGYQAQDGPEYARWYVR